MRKIKFRVWDKATKHMHICGEDVHDSCWYDNNNNFHYYNLQNGEGSGEHGDYILMQYTGLHDKNGKEIYEGDIVRVENTDLAQIIYDEDRMAWGIKPINDFYFDSPLLADNTSLELEVIGNIYDNPELLEG